MVLIKAYPGKTMGIGDGGQDLGILWIYLFHMKTNRVCVKSVGTMKS